MTVSAGEGQLSCGREELRQTVMACRIKREGERELSVLESGREGKIGRRERRIEESEGEGSGERKKIDELRAGGAGQPLNHWGTELLERNRCQQCGFNLELIMGADQLEFGYCYFRPP